MARKKKEKPSVDLTLYTLSGKPRKRKRKEKREYFNQDTEDAIVEYNLTNDITLKNKIFNTRINHSFFKLAENIINTFKFYYMDVESIEHLQHEVVIFLFDKIEGYDKNQGKAYSYFGTITKRYLITYNKNNYKKLKEKASLDEVDENKKITRDLMREDSEKDLIDFFTSFIKYMEENMSLIFPEPKDLDIAVIILNLFKNREDIEVFNKQYFYLCIRETTKQKTSDITRVLKEFKNSYKHCMRMHYLEGELSTDVSEINFN